jgi:hypothetical protein
VHSANRINSTIRSTNSPQKNAIQRRKRPTDADRRRCDARPAVWSRRRQQQHAAGTQAVVTTQIAQLPCTGKQPLCAHEEVRRQPVTSNAEVWGDCSRACDSKLVANRAGDDTPRRGQCTSRAHVVQSGEPRDSREQSHHNRTKERDRETCSGGGQWQTRPSRS